MTLDQFIKEQHKELERFAKNWIEQNKIEPENWPMEMNAGEWDEQLRSNEG